MQCTVSISFSLEEVELDKLCVRSSGNKYPTENCFSSGRICMIKVSSFFAHSIKMISDKPINGAAHALT